VVWRLRGLQLCGEGAAGALLRVKLKLTLTIIFAKSRNRKPPGRLAATRLGQRVGERSQSVGQSASNKRAAGGGEMEAKRQ
jgi:hypothetical protein